MTNRNFVIGGGLTAASFCYFTKEHNNIILEKENRLNGRTKSIPVGENAIEIGAQFFCKEDANIYNLIKELEIEDKLIRINLDDFTILHNNELIRLKSKTSNSFSDVENKELKKFFNFLRKEALDIFNNPDRNTISTDFERWYKTNIGQNTDWFINGLVRAITFSEPRKLSAFYGLLVCTTFFEPCFSIKKGLENLNKILLKKANPKILKEHEVKKIKIRDKRVESLRVNDKEIKIGEKDAVISTIPSGILSKLLPDSNLSRDLKKIEYGKCAVTLLKTKKNLLNYGSGILSTKKNGISIIIDESKYTGLKTEKGYIVILTPYNEEDRNIIDQTMKEAKELIPKLESNIEEKKFFKWDYGLPVASPQFFETQNKLLKNRIENLFICGDYIGTPSLDACIESSKLAAQQVSKYI